MEASLSFITQTKQHKTFSLCEKLRVTVRAVESEVPSSDSDSGQFRLSDSNSDLQLY